ncbi:hypothetical protein HGA88_06895 [Candidatus Roizmanbacteria bacterium]|nr:hypothetical protein [Candidatus Roizmanbacteria bacterium]
MNVLTRGVNILHNAFVEQGAEGLCLIEHFLPWVSKIMAAYQELKPNDSDSFEPITPHFSDAFYSRKIN